MKLNKENRKEYVRNKFTFFDDMSRKSIQNVITCKLNECGWLYEGGSIEQDWFFMLRSCEDFYHVSMYFVNHLDEDMSQINFYEKLLSLYRDLSVIVKGSIRLLGYDKSEMREYFLNCIWKEIDKTIKLLNQESKHECKSASKI